MTDIGVGDWVECVRSHSHDLSPSCSVVALQVYQVSWVGEGIWMGQFDFGIQLKEDRLPAECAWRMSDFRPIYRPKRDLIANLSAPVDADARKRLAV